MVEVPLEGDNKADRPEDAAVKPLPLVLPLVRVPDQTGPPPQAFSLVSKLVACKRAAKLSSRW